jgi:pimeloyl-ACP methyl ester carboxylesterase
MKTPVRLLNHLALVLGFGLSASALFAGEVPGPVMKVETLVIDGKDLLLKVPAQPAPGKPWLWVGEFGGHLQSLEDGLVAGGWHVAYLSFGNQFGSPAAMAAWEKAYDELHGKRGLAARPALLGISRGGLYVNAWTRLHPDRVSVLYLDNGVCDIRSWPGGFQLTDKGAGSEGDWNLYKQVFGFATDQEAREKSVRPADGFGAAVKAGIFLITVHGTADRTVPYVDNAKPVVEFWEKSNGRFKIFPKEGGDHHPHGLPDPKPLIDLLCAESKP